MSFLLRSGRDSSLGGYLMRRNNTHMGQHGAHAYLAPSSEPKLSDRCLLKTFIRNSPLLWDHIAVDRFLQTHISSTHGCFIVEEMMVVMLLLLKRVARFIAVGVHFVKSSGMSANAYVWDPPCAEATLRCLLDASHC